MTATECHDTMDNQTITRFIVRHVEGFPGYTSASGKFLLSYDGSGIGSLMNTKPRLESGVLC